MSHSLARSTLSKFSEKSYGVLELLTVLNLFSKRSFIYVGTMISSKSGLIFGSGSKDRANVNLDSCLLLKNSGAYFPV